METYGVLKNVTSVDTKLMNLWVILFIIFLCVRILYKNTFNSMKGQFVKPWAQVMYKTNTSKQQWRREK